MHVFLHIGKLDVWFGEWLKYVCGAAFRVIVPRVIYDLTLCLDGGVIQVSCEGAGGLSEGVWSDEVGVPQAVVLRPVGNQRVGVEGVILGHDEGGGVFFLVHSSVTFKA